MKTSVAANKRMFAIGDIHGCYDTLQAAFARLSITNDDLVIFAGDLIDRGTQIKEVLDYVFSRPNTVVVLGNHDFSFVRYLLGGEKTKKEYDFMLPQGLQETLDQLGPDATYYAEKLAQCPLSYQIEGVKKYIFCHANYPWDRGTWDERLLWDRDGHKPQPTEPRFLNYNGPIIVHGHTPVLQGEQFYEKVGKKIIGINLDMGAYYGVKGSGLRILDVNTGKIIEHLNSEN